MSKPQNVESTPVKLAEIPDNHVWRVDPTIIEAQLSGAYKAGFKNNGECTLVYEDAMRETASFTVDEAQALLDKNNWFSIVGAVQEKRPR